MTDWRTAQVPAGHDGVPLRRCWCGAAWLDYPDGRAAHAAVFDHPPALEAP
jgi:hypothetical protein